MVVRKEQTKRAYLVDCYHIDIDGSRKRYTAIGFKTKTDAMRFESQFKTSKEFTNNQSNSILGIY